MPNSNEKYAIEEKEINGVLKYHVQFAEELKVFDSALEANVAIKTFKMEKVFEQHTGMEIFISKD
ncbi:MAG: hypothetical protein H8E76_06570 [Helicobacteraceae bacterium]|nr:hypothetical protein [Candidatus Sulfurimonas ponti]